MEEARQYAVLGPMESGSETGAFLGCAVEAGLPRIDLPVVIVWLADDLAGDDEQVARIQRETAFAARLEHPHIVKVYGLERFDEGWARIERYADGASLARVLALARSADVVMEEPQIARILLDACSAVHFAHQTGRMSDGARPIVHGALCPDNLLVGFSGHTMVTAYGTAAWTVSPATTDAGQSSYLAPEQIIGGLGSASPTTDVYALGAVLLELLTGEPPFIDDQDIERAVLSGEVPQVEGEGLKARLGQVASIALAKRGADRFPTVKDLAGAIEMALGASAAHPEEVAAFVSQLIPEDSPDRIRRVVLLESATDLSSATILGRPVPAAGTQDALPAERSPSRQARPRKRDTIIEAPTGTSSGDKDAGVQAELPSFDEHAKDKAGLLATAGLAPEPEAQVSTREGSAPLDPLSFVGDSPFSGYEDFDPARMGSTPRGGPPAGVLEGLSGPESPGAPAEPPSAGLPGAPTPPQGALDPIPEGVLDPARHGSGVGHPAAIRSEAPGSTAPGMPGAQMGPGQLPHPPAPAGYAPEAGSAGYGLELGSAGYAPEAGSAGYAPTGPLPHPAPPANGPPSVPVSHGASRPDSTFPDPASGAALMPPTGLVSPAGGQLVGQPGGQLVGQPGGQLVGQPGGQLGGPLGGAPGPWPGSRPGPWAGGAAGMPAHAQEIPNGPSSPFGHAGLPSSGHTPGRGGAPDLLEGTPEAQRSGTSREISVITAFHRRTGDGSRSVIFLVGMAAIALLVFLFAFPKEPPEGIDAPSERSRLPPELVRAALEKKGPPPSPVAEPAEAAQRAVAAAPAAPVPDAGVVATAVTPGRLSLSSDPPVTVFEGSRELGRTPLTVKLDPGLHRLRFTDRKTGINFYRSYRIRAGVQRRDRIELGTGMLVVRAPDGAVVSLNARRLGRAPIEPVRIYEGEYLLRVSYDGMRWAERFEAGPGQTIEYKVTLRQ